MTGKYFVDENLLKQEQKKLIFYFDDGKKLIYCDSRGFGNFRLQPLDSYQKLNPYKGIGLDLLNEQIDVKYLFNLYQKRKVSIKVVLLEQDIISGIGNIYASEILFAAKIHPLRKACELSYEEVQTIVELAKSILSDALLLGGTSAFDFINPLAQKGNYQTKLKVYDRNGLLCYACNNLISKLYKKTNNRSTFFCLNCQN